MDASYEEGVIRFTHKIYRDYEDNIRRRDKSEIPFRFWDVVVVTASDDAQKQAYELQLNAKLQRREIPTGVDYLVFADPPGPKIGCGGATMHVIYRLTEIYGPRLSGLYVLLINAGGLSQRLPSASVLGKIFTALPTGRSPPWQVFELKLAAYVPLLARMSPGYLHVAADTIEVYDVGDATTDEWNLSCPGLTALAHPSTVDIGTTHGVFVLETNQCEPSRSSLMEFRNCLEVLQKPTVETLRLKNAILTTDEQEEYIYTDSLFYFDHIFADKLLDFYKCESPIQCEIDGYGDFMQSLGCNATSSFASETKNVMKANEHLVPTRLRLFDRLKGTQLNVVVANASKFYHLGTIVECLSNFCSSDELARFCGFTSVTFSSFDSELCAIKGCLINCFFSNSVNVGKSSLVEYCRFDGSVDIGDNCLITNCACDSEKCLTIPSNIFMHTVPVDIGNHIKYVTLVYHISDNVKVRADDAWNQLMFLRKPLSDSVKECTSDDLLFSCDASGDKCFTLWHARLFLAADSMSESFMASLHLLEGKALELSECTSVVSMSAAEVLANKDVHRMLAYRTELHDAITSSV